MYCCLGQTNRRNQCWISFLIDCRCWSVWFEPTPNQSWTSPSTPKKHRRRPLPRPAQTTTATKDLFDRRQLECPIFFSILPVTSFWSNCLCWSTFDGAIFVRAILWHWCSIGRLVFAISCCIWSMANRLASVNIIKMVSSFSKHKSRAYVNAVSA